MVRQMLPSLTKQTQRWATAPLALGLMSLFLLSPPAMAQEKILRTLTVTGRGKETLATTHTQIRLGVEAQAATANEVQAEVARKSNAVVTLLKARGVEKLETTGISLNPIYDYSNNQQVLKGYSASNRVSFRVLTKDAGTIMDDAVQAGATRIDGISFTAADDAITAAQKVALQKATQDARAQADAVLKSLNLTAQQIVSIQINQAVAPEPRFYDMEAAKARMVSAAPPSPVIGGEQEVEGTVTLQISY